MPRFSVVIPSYNHAAYIDEAVTSVLGQSVDDLELIVVDDGSTDDTLEVLAKFNDERLTVIRQENRGAHAAINRGLQKASAEYLAILNSDDAYEKERLAELGEVLGSRQEVGLVASHIQVVDGDGNRLGLKRGYHSLEPWPLEHPSRSFRAQDDHHAALLTENYLATTSNYLFRRSCFETVGGFRPLRYAHDWDFALRVIKEMELALVPSPLLRYRVHGANTIREDLAAMIFEICWILAVHLPQHVGLPRFAQQSGAEFTRRLLHSIYTYGFDRVLATMLLRRQVEQEGWASELLEADNPERQVYLDYIREGLTSRPGGTLVGSGEGQTAFLRRFRRLARAVFSRFQGEQ